MASSLPTVIKLDWKLTILREGAGHLNLTAQVASVIEIWPKCRLNESIINTDYFLYSDRTLIWWTEFKATSFGNTMMYIMWQHYGSIDFVLMYKYLFRKKWSKVTDACENYRITGNISQKYKCINDKDTPLGFYSLVFKNFLFYIRWPYCVRFVFLANKPFHLYFYIFICHILLNNLLRLILLYLNFIIRNLTLLQTNHEKLKNVHG